MTYYDCAGSHGRAGAVEAADGSKQMVHKMGISTLHTQQCNADVLYPLVLS